MAPTNIYVPGAPSIGKNKRRIFLGGAAGNSGITADFAGNNYSGMISVTRTASAYAQDSSGNLTLFAPNTARVTNLGLLREEAHTNLALQSQDYTQTATWPIVTGAVTRTAASITAPDGTLTGQLLADNATTNTNYGVKQAITGANTKPYCGYFIVKRKDYQWFQVNLAGSSSGNHAAYFDLLNGVVGTTTVGTLTRGMVPLANGWYLCWVMITSGIDSTITMSGIWNNSGTVSNHTGVVGTGTYVWGSQIVLANKVFSYVPTTSATATCDEDQVTASGTLLTAFQSSDAIATFISGSSMNGIAANLFDTNGTAVLSKTVANDTSLVWGGVSPTNTATVDWSAQNTVSIGWSPKGNTITLNGTPQLSPFTGTPAAPINIGSKWNGYIKSINVKQTSNISNSVSFRDWTPLARYVGNPTIPKNTKSFNTGGADAPYWRSGQVFNGSFFSIGFARTPNAAVNLGYDQIVSLTSSDLVSWAYNSTNPILSASLGAWDDHYLLHPSIILIGGTYFMYYSGMNSAGTAEQIGYATATDPVNGPWTKQGTVTPTGYALPSVIKIGSTYYMYAAVRPTGSTIVYFTSSDGITWTLGGTALTMNATDWDFTNTRIEDPWVFVNSRGYYEMVYTRDFNPGTFTQHTGYAVSADGVHWYKRQGLIITGSGTGGAFDQAYTGDPCLYENGGTLYLGFAGIADTVSTQPQGGIATMPSVYP